MRRGGRVRNGLDSHGPKSSEMQKRLQVIMEEDVRMMKKASILAEDDGTDQLGKRKRGQDHSQSSLIFKEHEACSLNTILAPSELAYAEWLISNASLSREHVLKAMIFFLENAKFAANLSELLTSPFKIGSEDECEGSLTPSRAVALLYILSDVMHNANAAVSKASAYRAELQPRIPRVFFALGIIYRRCGKISAQNISERVYCVIESWRSGCIFPEKFLFGLEGTFKNTIRTTTVDLYSVKSTNHNDSIEDLKSSCIQNGILPTGSREELRLRLNIVKNLFANQKPSAAVNSMSIYSGMEINDSRDKDSLPDSIDGYSMSSSEESDASEVNFSPKKI